MLHVVWISAPGQTEDHALVKDRLVDLITVQDGSKYQGLIGGGGGGVGFLVFLNNNYCEMLFSRCRHGYS